MLAKTHVVMPRCVVVSALPETAVPPIISRSLNWLLPVVVLGFALVIACVFLLRKGSEAGGFADPAAAKRERPAASVSVPKDFREEQALRRALLEWVEKDGLEALARIDVSWPAPLRNRLRRDMLEHHGIQAPLESLDWLARHPKIDGAGPLGVELTASLHSRAGEQAGSLEPWQTAFERLDRIASHGTVREHLAYLQSALTAMRSEGVAPFTAGEIRAMRLRPATKAVALASLGDLGGGLELLQPAGPDYPVAHLAAREWLTLGMVPLSLTETANRLLSFAEPGEEGPAQVVRTLRHPHLDRSLALWLRSHPAGPARDAMMEEIVADISLHDPSFARALLQESPP